MLKRGLQIAATFSARGIPGLLSLVALLVLASKVPISTYGYFSAALATAGVASNVLFGPVHLSVVPQSAGHAQAGTLKSYTTTAFCLTAGVGLATVALGYGGRLLGLEIALPASLLALGIASHTVAQELLRARLRLLAYATSDVAQASAFLCYVALFASDDVGEIVLAYAGSYLAGLIVSAFFLIEFGFGKPALSIARRIVATGRWLTFGTLSEGLLSIGIRYVIIWAGTPQLLGVFSIAADLSQKTIGFAMSAVAFLYVPRAFRQRACGNLSGFRQELIEGAGVAVLAGLSICLLLATFRSLPVTKEYFPNGFELFAYMVVGAGTAANRLKKILVDPAVIASGRAHQLWMANVIGGAAGLAMAFGCLSFGMDAGVMIAYVAGYVLIALTAILISYPKRVSRLLGTPR